MLLYLLILLFTPPQHPPPPEVCELKGAVCIKSVPGLADYRGRVIPSGDLADLRVLRTEDKRHCDSGGQWAYTTNRAEADFSIYLEKCLLPAIFSLPTRISGRVQLTVSGFWQGLRFKGPNELNPPSSFGHKTPEEVYFNRVKRNI